ncbi:MAG: RNA polymerase sigma factor [Stenotrophomonas acidaminiphila]|nr:RNA polymerase sigma factor [Stenotrophomonas acidaminiphila]
MPARSAVAARTLSLVGLAKAGDRAAFGQLVEEHYDFIFRTACKWTGRKSDAEDIAQDCMERLIRYREHPHAELKLLLYRIARNRLADRGRSPHAAPHLPLAEQDLPSEAPFSTPGPLRQAESGQMLNALRQALLKLPERCREVYLLNRITGMSYSQIARHRGITAKTVEKHVARALQGLRRELGADAFGMGGDE